MVQGALLASGRTAGIYAWGSDRVLKLFREAYPPEAAEYEAMAMRAVRGAGLPVPAVDGVTSVDGRSSIIMERIQGPTMMEAMMKQPWMLRRHARNLAGLHVRLHRSSVPGLQPLGLEIWYSIARAKGIPMPVKQSLMTELVRLPHGESVCHYDLHPMNVIMSAGGPVIIDWQGAGTGYAMLDVARSWLLMRHAVLPTSFPWSIALRAFRAAFYRQYSGWYNRLFRMESAHLRTCMALIVAARCGEVPEEEKLLLPVLDSLLASTGIASGVADVA